MNTLDRYLYRTVLVYALMAMGVLLTLGALFLFISQQSDIGVGDYSEEQTGYDLAILRRALEWLRTEEKDVWRSIYYRASW